MFVCDGSMARLTRKGSPCIVKARLTCPLRAMPRAGKKRKAAITQLNHEDVSFSLTSRCVKQSRYISTRNVEDFSLIQTPYGQLTKTLHVRGTSGEPLAIKYCCPFAWLYHICLKCELMLHFLLAALQGSPGNVVAQDIVCAQTRHGR